MNHNTINLLDLLEKIVKHRWLLLRTVFIITIVSLIISLIWPKTYKSTVRFFPPPRSSEGISGILSNFLPTNFTVSELSSEAMLVILNSRSLAESVIKRFKLDEVYDEDIPEFLLKKFEANIEIEEIREGGFGFNPIVSVEVSFYDEEAARAQQVTAYIVTKLDTIIQQIYQERANHNFSLIEMRFLENVQDLKTAETRFKEFQEEYGIFEIEAQTRSAIQTLAELKAKIIKNEIELEFLQRTVSSENFQILQLKHQKAALEKKYRELIQVSDIPENDDKVFHPLEEVPGLFAIYTQLYREATVQNKIYEFLYPQYEQAKLKATTQSQGIRILDSAQLPTYKDKPKRLFIVLAGFAFSVILGLFLVFFKEYLETQRQAGSPSYQKLVYIRDALKHDLRIIRRKR